ncbi:hypothetical protein CA13_10950 [Planctomycetes bacterium CA13]|uniref:Bacterial type II and III secretion system protein n=1 Tax=Novipirellula herctigrandis TaxID=2527986 RepID=A0A5C5YXA2_9BACT|nr:hypothetical protein CA13_10950 [Planctomycetes bacterium CA13]
MNYSFALWIAMAVAISCNLTNTGYVFAEPQELPSTDKGNGTHHSQHELPQRYFVSLAEYRFKDFNPAKVTAEKIQNAISSENASHVETVMLSAVAGFKSMVQFGRSVTVTTGRVSNRDVMTRQTQQQEIGTILEVTVSPEDQSVVADLSFSSSRIVGEGTDDSPPEFATTTIKTTQLMDIGKPTLVGASTVDKSSYIFLTISRQ